MSDKEDNCQCPLCLLRRGLESGEFDSSSFSTMTLRIPKLDDLVGFTRDEIVQTVTDDYTDNPHFFNACFLEHLFKRMDEGVRITQDVVTSCAEAVMETKSFQDAMTLYLTPPESDKIH